MARHDEQGPVPEVTPESVQAAAKGAKRPLLLDCRTPAEHATAKIEGARLMPMDEVADRVEELAGYRGEPIVVFCHHGARSLGVAGYLQRAGFERVSSMAGGIDAWSQRVDGSVPRY